MNIFIGNLNSQATEKQLEDLFTPYGEVRSVKIIVDSFSGRSKGFAFLDMPEQENAERAIKELNQTHLNTQAIVVNEARPKKDPASRPRY